ncbi:NEDD4-binding protein 1-like [Gigantopelta aegis]|uniref:NEDD4-binding protein 1-like n=1 Tax=Gigantopelta aegis TaxID=1735272 RepID=UPI001B88C319|nr:NEDD4-binding protein 1-like [Gigantopelta aegis]
MSVQMVKDVDNIVDNFIVDKKHTPNIEPCLKKIQDIFGVKVEFDNVVKITGESEKQWLKITGGKWDKQSAKEYIIGLCNPEETLVYKCRRSLLHDELMNIEKDTNAVIQCLSDRELNISGTQLAVTLALSAVEELTNNSTITQESTDTNNHSAVMRDSAASERLQSTLQRALTEIGDGNSKSEDYQAVPDSVKRVILDCLSHEDISEADLFESDAREINVKCSAASHFSSKNHPHPHHHHTSSGDASTTKTAYASSLLGGLETDGGAAFQKSEVAALSSRKECGDKNNSGGDKNNSDLNYLRKLGLSVGYSCDEVEEGLLLLNDSVKPADYLHILQNIKEDKDRAGTAAPAQVGSNSPAANIVSDAIVIPDSTEMNSDHDDDVVFISEHFKTPLKPVKTKGKVGGLSSMEKQEMSLNQKELKDLYKKQQQQQQSTTGNKSKGKRDKKVPQHQDQGSAVGQAKRTKSPLGVKRKQVDSSDDDQTCVMEVWQLGDVGQSSHPQSQPCVPINQSQPYMPISQSQPYVHISQDNLIPDLMELSTQSSRPVCNERQPRYIVVDGSNVAMEHGNGRVFSCRGIEICVNYFLARGHKVTTFVPQWRKYRPSFSNTIVDQAVLDRLHSNGNLVFTPSRRIQGKTIASYDDRYVLSLAEKEDGIIVSNDQYRDLMQEKQSWCKIIEERLLMFNFVNDHFMPPEDPLGRNGPRLDEFLTKPAPARRPPQQQQQPEHHSAMAGLLPTPPMPRFQHPAVLVNPQVVVQPNWHRDYPKTYHQDWPRRDNQHNHGVPMVKAPRQRNTPIRHQMVTEQLFEALRIVFPEMDQEEKIRDVLRNHSAETDLNRLTNYCMSALFP